MHKCNILLKIYNTCKRELLSCLRIKKERGNQVLECLCYGNVTYNNIMHNGILSLDIIILCIGVTTTVRVHVSVHVHTPTTVVPACNMYLTTEIPS